MKRKPPARKTADRARGLRRNSTKPEAILWSALRSGRLAGLKFRRQHPIGPYFADFYCHSVCLVVEIDGMSHDDRAKYDHQRTDYMNSAGIKVIRVTNDDVLEDLDAVVRYIARQAGIQLT